VYHYHFAILRKPVTAGEKIHSMKTETDMKTNTTNGRGLVLLMTLLLSLGTHPATGGIFGGVSQKDLTGVWIKTANYQDTIEIFEDGNGRWRDGTFVEWKLLDDGRLKIVSGGENKKILIGATKDLAQKELYIEASEYIPYDPSLAAVYTALAMALHRQPVINESIDYASERYRGLRQLDRNRQGGVGGALVAMFEPAARDMAMVEIKKAKSRAQTAVADCNRGVDQAIQFAPSFARAYIVKAQCFDYQNKLLELSSRLTEDFSQEQGERFAELRTSYLREGIAARVKAISIGLTTHWKAEMFNALARTHATIADPDFQNGPLAVAYAQQAISLQPDQISYLDTLAAAHARMDDFKEAIAVQKKAIALLPASQEADRTGYAACLALYEQGQAYTAAK
jgi:tetratricopeptide (TPR) repeat protein